MEVTYKNPTQLASAQKEWGLPYQKLPAATQRDMSPESVIGEQIQTGRKQIWDSFTLRWDEINRSRQFIGAGKAQRMQRELHTKAKQDMLAFNQKTQMQTNQLRNISQLAQQGMIDNADYLKAYVVFGAAMAKSMYPKPEKEKEAEQIPEMFGKLDLYSHKLATDREQFRIVKEGLPGPPSKLLGLVSPAIGAISAYGKISKLKKAKGRAGVRNLQIWDPTIPVRVPEIINGKKTGRILDEMGDWRKADKEETTAYEFILKEEKAVARRKTELQSRFGVSQRMGLGISRGGGFNDAIAESVHGPATRQPTRQPTRQRGPQSTTQPIFSDPLGLR